MQQVFAQGELVSEPLAHYRNHREAYDYIADRLRNTRKAFLSASRNVQKSLLFDSATNALISASTRLNNHESAFIEYRLANGRDEILEALQGNSVLYHNNKTDYIVRNEDIQMDDIIDEIEAGNLDTAHRAILDQFAGLGARKAGFTLAMLGFTEKMCIDGNVARKCGLDKSDIYEGVVIERYEAQCREIRSQFPDLADELDPFLWQWVVFDSERGTVTAHDPWFMAVEEITGEIIG